MSETQHAPALLRVLRSDVSRTPRPDPITASETLLEDAPVTRGKLPLAPRRLEDTGLSEGLLSELLLKTLYVRGPLRLPELGSELGLAATVLDPLLQFLRAERMCEVTRRGETDASQTYSLTENGHLRAQDYLQRNQYVGTAPVGLQSYIDQVR